ncbi:ArsB/NhaD family transporter [Rhodococcus artemisiae]|uniref:SLC13 family permease n=1 Tax=Rhodococcus artemisiae TaxID=714159 RepID=A0ABU7LCM1_9NOCA|nr:SLC13 family permease [Rhodococcus artemisiae]MEE2059017.1 SLC13 family permease [Rhodococcus artemisiae]
MQNLLRALPRVRARQSRYRLGQPSTAKGPVLTLQLGALLICVAVFAIGLYRGVNVGILLFAVAAAVGVGLADLPVKEVISGFPIDLMILLAGVTFFFGVAQVNGTVDRLIDAALRRIGHRPRLLPLAFFGLTGAVASMGNPGAALVVMPIGMNVARKKNINPTLMAIAMGTGMSAGGFAPTSTFGIIINGTAREANIDFSPVLLFAIALVVNLILLAVAHLIFGRSRYRRRTEATARASAHVSDRDFVTVGPNASAITPSADFTTDEDAIGLGTHGPFTFIQKSTVACIFALIAAVIGANALGMSPDIGVVTFSLGAILILLDPKSAKDGAAKIDWSTILLVGGIITYVGVLQEVGTIDMLADYAASMSVPLLAALLICVVAGLVSAFASTIGMLAVLVPLAIPLITYGGIPGWAMICAIGVCASIVDVSPFSSSGATMIATYPDADERPRMTKMLMRWGLSLVIIGPVAMIGAVIIPAMLL